MSRDVEPFLFSKICYHLFMVDILLDAEKLTPDQINSIRALAEEIYANQKEEDIFKATIEAVFTWISLSIHEDEVRH